MSDIVERLRSYLVAELDTSDDAARERDNLIAEAADEIERLRRENEQLKVSMVRTAGAAHRGKRVLEVRPRDEVIPGAFTVRMCRE